MIKGGKKGISAAVLKMIAVVTMAIDHTGASVVERLLEYGRLPLTQGWWDFYLVFRYIGRMAFPIYIYLLVEGFYYTHNRKKYALRLFLFALISELPFDMALYDTYCLWDSNNVFFELFLGLLMLCCLDFLQNRMDLRKWIPSEPLAAALKGLAGLAVIAGFACLAEYVVRCDYGIAGITAIAMLYIFRQNRMLAFTMAVLALTCLSSRMEIAALVMLIPMHFYNGSRGRQMKYFFYAFYPVHLLVLAGICAVLGLGI